MVHKKTLVWLLTICILAHLWGTSLPANAKSSTTVSTTETQTTTLLEEVPKEPEVPQTPSEKEISPEETEPQPNLLLLPEPLPQSGFPQMPAAVTPASIGLQKSAWEKWKALNGNNFTQYQPELKDEEILTYHRTEFKDIKVMNTESPLLKDGEVEFILRFSGIKSDNSNEGRFGIIYRASETEHAMLKFEKNENGQSSWLVESAAGWGAFFSAPIIRPQEWYKLKIRYQNNNVKLYINDTLAADKTVSDVSGYPNETGHIGFRDHYLPKGIEIRSIKNGPLDSLPSLDMTEYARILQDAKEKASSPDYTTSSRLKLKAVLSGLSNFYNTQAEITEKIDALKTAIAGLKPETAMETEILHSEQMEVIVSKEFPQVISYKMKEHNNAVMNGQKNRLSTLKINDIEIFPEVSSQKAADHKVEYTLKCMDGDINCTLKAEIVLDADTLRWAVTEIENHNTDLTEDRYLVRTIEVPNLSLISINSRQNLPEMHASKIRTNTRSGGDIVIELTDLAPVREGAYYIAEIHNDTLAASLYTNSDLARGASPYDWDFVKAAITEESDGSKSIGLGSAPWVYQRGTEYRVQNETIAGETELPFIRVKIVGDANQDGIVNWNDGALAYRAIAPHRFGSEMVPDTVAIRIAMNFGSQAQNPFLVTLDNVKKVFLNTDGLGQNILLKGYGSEGHDSGHLNYADIGRRIGGAEDMKLLLSEGHKYGARFGIHVNASETYPESKYFSEERLKKDGSGYSYGWNWLDQGININADYDLKNGRAERFADLAKALDNGSGKNDLDYIYVDVWGNGQSGDNSSWPSSQLAKEIQKQGWAVAGEWGHAFANAAIFQHWAADVTYGGFQNKGINSKLIRFIQNSQRDSWTANYASYSGAALNPLLGGYNMKDFEGWQGRNGYAAYIYNLFRVDVPSKFVQHFEVMKWENGNPIALPDVPSYIPDVKIELNNSALSKNLVIERGAADYNANPESYRSRTMTLDGREILREKPDYHAPKDETLVEYLLPWYWNANGKRLPESEEKLYAFTNRGAEADWQLLEAWADLDKLYCYELTDLGRTNEQEIPVNNGRIQLKLTDGTPYVLYKTPHPEDRSVEWSNHAHIVDTGFNSRSLAHWQITGGEEGKHGETTISVVDTESGTQVLKISSNTEKVTLSQSLTELKPKTRYAAYVGVENRGDAKAFLEIAQNGYLRHRNETGKSLALNYVQAYSHNTNRQSYTVDGTSYFQNMYVFFQTPSSADGLSLRIGREAGDGTTYFDDIRVMEAADIPYSETTEGKLLVQDFENVPQGLYPFVVAHVEGVQDNRQHLSERHEPYTQRGWHTKQISDVIDGNWSLKVNGLIGRNRMLFYTIPQNYQFQPGKTYQVSFDYLAGTDKAFDFIIGSGSYDELGAETVVYSESLSGTRFNTEKEAGHYTFEFSVPTGKEDYWIGIFSNQTPADLSGVNPVDADFSGVKDFILDNLKILEKATTKVNKDLLANLFQKASKIKEAPDFKQRYTKDSIYNLEQALAYAEERLNSDLFAQEHINLAVEKLSQALQELTLYLPDTAMLQNLLRNAERILADSTYADEFKPELAAIAAEVKTFLQQSYLPEEEISEYTGRLKNALDKVRVSKHEVEYEIKEEQIHPDLIQAASASSEAPYDGDATKDKVVDGSLTNFWHNDWYAGTTVPHWLILKLDKPHLLSKLNYVARFNRPNGAGRIKRYSVEVSSDGENWTPVLTDAAMPWTPANIYDNPIVFPAATQAQYIRFTITQSDGNLGVITELEFFEKKSEAKEIVPLPQILQTEELIHQVKTAQVLKLEWSYPYASAEKRTAFEQALTNAENQLQHLFESTVMQEHIDQTANALKAAIAQLDGRSNLLAKEKEVKAMFDAAMAESYSAETEQKLMQALMQLPEYSPTWLELHKRLQAYRSQQVPAPYTPSEPAPTLPAPATSQKPADSKEPKITPTDSQKDTPKVHSFKDVPAGIWYEAAVGELYQKGLLQGISADTFAPQEKVSRAMLPVILFRLEEGGKVPEAAANSTWYDGAVTWAKEKGYIMGDETGDYQPNQEITRQDFLVILYRFAMAQSKLKTATNAVSENRPVFADDTETADYAKDAVRWATSDGILKGRPDGKYYPRNLITRAEMAEILIRLLKIMEK